MCIHRSSLIITIGNKLNTKSCNNSMVVDEYVSNFFTVTESKAQIKGTTSPKRFLQREYKSDQEVSPCSLSVFRFRKSFIQGTVKDLFIVPFILLSRTSYRSSDCNCISSSFECSTQLRFTAYVGRDSHQLTK